MCPACEAPTEANTLCALCDALQATQCRVCGAAAHRHDLCNDCQQLPNECFMCGMEDVEKRLCNNCQRTLQAIHPLWRVHA